MTRCAPDCGACCDPVLLSFPLESMDGPSAPFARKHWTVIEDHPCLPEGIAVAVRCDGFNPTTRACTAYENRPPICSGFPWYGKAPDPQRALNLTCAFIADVRPVLPLVMVNGV